MLQKRGPQLVEREAGNFILPTLPGTLQPDKEAVADPECAAGAPGSPPSLSILVTTQTNTPKQPGNQAAKMPLKALGKRMFHLKSESDSGGR